MFTKKRLAGKLAREKKRAEDRRVVAEGEHLIRKELKEMEEENLPLESLANKNLSHVVGAERLRTKKKTRLLVDGGTQDEMEID